MHDTRIPLLKIKNDSNASEDSSLTPTILTETTGPANVDPNFSSRSGPRHRNVVDSEPLWQSLGEQRADRLGEPTHFMSFSDGTLVETVRDPQRREAFRLLVYKDQKALIVNRFEHDGDCFVPGEIDRNLARYLPMSTGISPCGQPRELVAELVATFRKYVDLPDDVLQVIGAFVLCSWFPDRLRVAPYL